LKEGNVSAAEKWAKALASWAIPQEIIDQAEQSPWIHPPALFTVPKVIPDSPSHQRARELISESGSVLDVGCGGGIAAFACTPPAKTVIGVDHQQEMLNLFAAEANERNLNHQEFLGDWPDVANQVPVADVVTCHHVVYNVSEISEFLLELDNHASKRVVLEMPQSHPLSGMTKAWKHFWNLDRPTTPSPQELIEVLAELGIKAHLETWEVEFPAKVDFDQAAEFMRIRLCLSTDRLPEVKNFMKENPEPQFRKLATIWWDK
jgi:SAM-dependent methyltransferase